MGPIVLPCRSVRSPTRRPAATGRARLGSVALALWTALAGLPAPGAPEASVAVRLNEVCYDPEGPDAGFEFIELHNTDPLAVSLAGWSLEAGNGARVGDWRLQWRGGGTDRIPAGGFFVVAGALVPEPVDARANLQLQNGPDAVRLCGPRGELIDLVGWGEHAFAEYSEGAPAEDAGSGWVIARIPDGADSDRNAVDWTARPIATAGGSNAPDWCLRLLGIGCDPPLLDPGDTGALQITAANCGLRPVDLDALECRSQTGRFASATPEWAGGALEANAIRTLECRLQAHRVGVESLLVTLHDPAGHSRRVSRAVRVGRGAVLISEVCYDPAAEEGEWIELLNASAEAQDLTGWRASDASGQTITLGPSSVWLGSGEFALLAENPAALCSRWEALSAGDCLPRSGSWPSLNNGCDRARGFSDEVCLWDAEGHPVDYVRYRSGSLDGAGITLERWIEDGRLIEPKLLVPCAQPEGATPGRAGWGREGAQGDAGWLRPSPPVFYPDRAGTARYCRITVPPPPGPGATVSADVYSLAGVRVATLIAGADLSGPLAVLWDGCDGGGRELGSGLYLVRVVMRAAEQDRRQIHVRAVALVRG